MEYRQQYYTAFTVDSVDTDLQQLIEVRRLVALSTASPALTLLWSLVSDLRAL